MTQATEATISLTILIDVATVATVGGAVVDSRSADVERTAFEIDRAALGILTRSVVEVISVTTYRRVVGEGAARNDHVSGGRQTRKPAAESIERGVIV